MIDLILNEPQLLFSLALTAKTCLVALAGFIAGLPLVVRPLQAAFASPRLIELEEAARIHGASRRDVFLRVTLPLVRPSLAAALLLGSAASRARWARQHLGAHQHALARNLQRRLTRRLRRRERALPPALALCGRHLPCGRAPHQAQPKALTSNAHVTRETLRLDSSGMADRVKWKDYPILLNYPP